LKLKELLVKSYAVAEFFLRKRENLNVYIEEEILAI